MASESESAVTQTPRAAITAWLGVLFLLVLVLMTVGGFVRLSESGLSLAGWPTVGGRILPPVTEAGWQDHFNMYVADLADLKERKAAGEIGIGIVPPTPADVASFRQIYLTEFSHRALAALVAIVGLGCLVSLLRRRELRRLAGGPLVGVLTLVVIQSVIGGILVLTGTSTHWLFVHMGLATGILGLVMWALLLMLKGHRRPAPWELRCERRSALRWTWVAVLLVFAQIVLGALVAGSRQYGMSTTWPLMNGVWVPELWNATKALAWNLIDNAALHQWVHRWFAWLVVAGILVAARQVAASSAGPRARLAMRFAVSTVFVQIALGLLNVFSNVDILIALTHLVVALMLFTGLVIQLFDLHHESAGAEVATAASDDAAGARVWASEAA